VLPTLVQTLPRSDRANLLAIVLGVGMAFYLAIEPTQEWLLLVLAGLAALGMDGVLRSHPSSPFARLDDTASFLFLPALLTLGGGLFLEDVVSGYWSVPVGALTTIGFAAVLNGQYLSVDGRWPVYPTARLVVSICVYVAAFALFSVVYEFDVGLLGAAFSVGLVSLILSLEILREATPVGATPQARTTIVYTGAIGCSWRSSPGPSTSCPWRASWPPPSSCWPSTWPAASPRTTCCVSWTWPRRASSRRSRPWAWASWWWPMLSADDGVTGTCLSGRPGVPLAGG